MSLGILGNKIGMTQIFNTKGDIIPVTIIKGGPCYITQIKLMDSDGYNALQLGYTEINPFSNKLTKPLLGHFNKRKVLPYKFLKEYQVQNPEEYKIGEKISINLFTVGQKICVSGLTIGKGNASNIKRNHFSRGPMSHGSKHHRLQGSLGAGTTPGRVFPGKKMPGRLGMEKCTIKNLEIIGLDEKENLLIIKGSVPGKFGNLLNLKPQI